VPVNDDLEKLRTRWRRWLGNKTRRDKDNWITLLDSNWIGWAGNVMGDDYRPLSLRDVDREAVKAMNITRYGATNNSRTRRNRRPAAPTGRAG
jgi:hypothetical protein